MISLGNPSIAQILGKNYKIQKPKIQAKPKPKVKCPHCGSQNTIKKRFSLSYRKCRDCQNVFNSQNLVIIN